MSLPPSGSVLIKKVNENNDFIEDVLSADDVPVTATGLPYSDIGINADNLEDFIDQMSDSIVTASGYFDGSINTISDNLTTASGVLQDYIDGLTKSKYVLVKSLKDLPQPVGDVITLSGQTVYELNGRVDLVNTRLVLDQFTIILGSCQATDGFSYSGTEALFTAINKSFAIKTIGIECPSANRQLFNIQGSSFNGYRIQDLRVGNYAPCNSLGTINGGYELSLYDNKFNNLASGIIINDIEQCFIKNNYFRSYIPNTTKYLTLLSGTNYDFIDIIENHFELKNNETALTLPNITISGGCIIQSNSFNILGTNSSALNNDAIYNNLSYEIKNNYKLRDNKTEGFIEFFENTTETTIPNTTSYIKALGTNYYTKFERTDVSINNRIIVQALHTKVYELFVNGAVSCTGQNQTLRVALYKNGTDKVVETETRNVTANQSTNFGINYTLQLDPNDYIEVFVRNTSSTNNITLEFLQFLIKE